jgi:HK97 family phage major capsid protein
MNQLNYVGRTVGRLAKALAATRGDALEAAGYAAAQRWTDSEQIVTALKATITATTTNEMTTSRAAVAADFAALLRPGTIIGKLPGVRRAPFNTRVISQTAGTVARFVGEGRPVPVTTAGFESVILQQVKVGGICVITRELALSSRSGADMIIANDLRRAVEFGANLAFVDPNNSGSAESPASITNGAVSISSSGSSLAAVDNDLRALVEVLVSAEADLATAAWVMSGKTATSLTLLRGASGAPAFPGMAGPLGGTLLGLPVIVSDATRTLGSPNQSIIVLISGDAVTLADEGDAEVTAAGETVLQLDDAPGAGASAQVSLFQANLVALKGLRHLNWSLRHAGGVATLTDVDY